MIRMAFFETFHKSAQTGRIFDKKGGWKLKTNRFYGIIKYMRITLYIPFFRVRATSFEPTYIHVQGEWNKL